MFLSKKALLLFLSCSQVAAFTPNTIPNTNLAFTTHPSNEIRTSTWLSMADPSKITMPALSSTMKEGRIVSWLKNEGDSIEAGEAIMVVESDKADMDVEAFEDGFLAKIYVGEGESANVGDTVALIVEEESEIAGAADVSADADTSEESGSVEEAPEAVEEGASYDFTTTEIFMPALSSTMSEGKIVSWLKSPGDQVTAGEAIMVVESDKADMDVEAFEDGYLAVILTEEGEMADVGAPVGILVEEEGQVDAVQAGGAPTSAASTAAPKASTTTMTASPATPKPSSTPTTTSKSSGDRVVASPLAKKKAASLGLDISTIAGTGPNGRITASDVEAAASGAAPATPAASQEAPAKPKHIPAAGVVAATPMARAAAKKARLDLASIEGTGEFGRVTLTDVQIATGEKKPARKSASKPGQAVVEMPEGVVPFTGMQRAVSNNMEATLSTPVFRASREIRMDNFNALYKDVKPKGVTVSALLAKAVAMAVEKHPIINSSYDPNGGTVFNKDINIAMAVAIDGGLITPTLKYANERNIFELGEDWKSLVGKAKSGTLAPDDYNSGTFTISNLGMFGVSQFDAILPVGQGCILAIGATQEKVVPDKQAVLGLKTINAMTITLTCDHRQIYGADAALFMKTLADIMENQTTSLVL